MLKDNNIKVYKRMPDYQKAKVYRIVNDVNGKTYYGSTCLSLSTRMCKHRWSFKNDKNKSTYLKLGNILECKIFLIENHPCNSKEELLKRERFYIENNECINLQIPGRTKKEWNASNKEYFQQYNKKYRLENKTILSEKRKKYYSENKTILSEKLKEYRLKNKKVIAEKKAVKSDCECGGKYTRDHRAQHFKTLKHLKHLENKSKP